MENNNDLPFINLSKENLLLLNDMFDAAEIGNIMIAITQKVYFDKEPTQLTKMETVGYNQLMLVINRKAEAYHKKVAKGTENFKKVNERKKKEKEDKSDDLSCYTEQEHDVVQVNDEEKIKEFFTENRQYLENNYSRINGSTVNGNPKLLNFMSENGFTADTIDKVYQQMKNNNQ